MLWASDGVLQIPPYWRKSKLVHTLRANARGRRIEVSRQYPWSSRQALPFFRRRDRYPVTWVAPRGSLAESGERRFLSPSVSTASRKVGLAGARVFV